MRIGRLMDFKIVKRFCPLITETTRGYPVIDAGVPIQLMVHHRGNGNSDWMVSEWTTGQRIDTPSRATSCEMAVMMAVQKVRELPPGKLEALLADAPEVNANGQETLKRARGDTRTARREP